MVPPFDIPFAVDISRLLFGCRHGCLTASWLVTYNKGRQERQRRKHYQKFKIFKETTIGTGFLNMV